MQRGIPQPDTRGGRAHQGRGHESGEGPGKLGGSRPGRCGGKPEARHRECSELDAKTELHPARIRQIEGRPGEGTRSGDERQLHRDAAGSSRAIGRQTGFHRLLRIENADCRLASVQYAIHELIHLVFERMMADVR